MTRTRAELILLVALLAGAWLAVGKNAGAPPSSLDSPLSNGDVAAPSPTVNGLPQRAEALRASLAMPRTVGAARRNLFRFREAAPAAGRGAAGSSAVTPVANPAPPRPEMSLSGIAEETGNGHPVRTAVISVTGRLVFAREGDRVLSRFVVLQIAADAVQLKDGDGGETFILALR